MRKIQIAILGILAISLISSMIYAFSGYIHEIDPIECAKHKGDIMYCTWVELIDGKKAWVITPTFEKDTQVRHISFWNNGNIEIYTSDPNANVTINGVGICLENGMSTTGGKCYR